MLLISRFLLTLLLLLLSLPSLALRDKLLFAVDVIRHGDRTPIEDLPKSPYHWPQGPGQLTPTGMQQEFQLGTAMRKVYIKDGHLLPDQFNAETLYVRSSDFDRTLMSAESLLLGLYPLGTGPKLPTDKTALPSGFQPVPIHTISQASDTLLVWSSHNPNEYEELLQNQVYSQADWKRKTAELQPQFSRWSKMTGMKITNLKQVIRLGDTLFIRQIYHVPLPAGLTPDDEKTILAARDWAFAALFRPKAIGQFTGKQLLSVIGDYLTQASQHPGKLKWVLFSGHDTTILSLMSAMGTPMDAPPPYASDLNFTLYENEAGEKRIQISLNGRRVNLPNCKEQACTLPQFEHLAWGNG